MRTDNDTCCKESQKTQTISLSVFFKEIEVQRKSDVDNSKKLISINLWFQITSSRNKNICIKLLGLKLISIHPWFNIRYHAKVKIVLIQSRQANKVFQYLSNFDK